MDQTDSAQLFPPFRAAHFLSLDKPSFLVSESQSPLRTSWDRGGLVVKSHVLFMGKPEQCSVGLVLSWGIQQSPSRQPLTS